MLVCFVYVNKRNMESREQDTESEHVYTNLTSPAAPGPALPPAAVSMYPTNNAASTPYPAPVPVPTPGPQQYQPQSQYPQPAQYPQAGAPPPYGYGQPQAGYPPQPGVATAQYVAASPQQQPQQQQQQVLVVNAAHQPAVVFQHVPSFTGQIAFACVVFWCFNWLFGLIAFILAC